MNQSPRSHVLAAHDSSLERLVRSRAARAIVCALLAAAAFVAVLTVARPAAAQRELLSRSGERGHLVLDQLSGFRASYDGGFTYYGILGFSVQRYRLDSYAQLGGNNAFEGTRSTTTFFISPSADYFVIDKLSIGMHLELAFVSGSDEVRINPNVTQTFTRPSTTNVTFLPRIGYMFPIGDRFAIWPRVGLGYTSQKVVNGVGNAAGTESFGAAIMDIDVGLLYRFTDVFFVKMAPQLTFSLGGSRSQTAGGLTVSADASLFQFSALAGVGVMLDLL